MKRYPLLLMDKTFIQSFDNSIAPWERGVRKGGLMNKEIMAENLLDFKEVLDRHGVLFLLFGGCLLGIIRENDFFSVDSDVDVICFNGWERKDHEKMKKVKDDLISKGFHIVDSNVCPLHNDFFVRNGEKIEIWWFDKIDDEWIFGDSLRYSAEFFDNPEEIDFLGTKFKVPSNPEKWLELHYGKDWRIENPQRQWLSQKSSEVEKRNKVPQTNNPEHIKLSIVMTSYKKNETLPLVLSSLSRQTIPCSYEILMLNDYLDNDGTKEICESYKDKLNIRYLFAGRRNTPEKIIRRATVTAINAGVKHARGDIIIINSPEVYHLENDNIIKILNLFPLDSKIRYKKMVCYPSKVKDDNGDILKALKENIKIERDKLDKLNNLEAKFPFFIAFYKEDFINIGGGDEDFVGNAWDDQDLTDRLSLSGCEYMERNIEVVHLYHKRLDYNSPEIKEGWNYNKRLYDTRKGLILRNKHREWGLL